MQKRKGESIPKGWAVDSEGQITDDPLKVLDEDGGLLYLGGAEETGGYKGYGLSMMVEVLGGILGGGPFGQNIRRWKNDARVANLVSLSVCLYLYVCMCVCLLSLSVCICMYVCMCVCL